MNEEDLYTSEEFDSDLEIVPEQEVLVDEIVHEQNQEIIDNLEKINLFIEDYQQKSEEDLLLQQEEISQQLSNDEILVSIQDLLVEQNSYLYTLNVYFAGFFVIVITMILIKALIGFFKPFL